MCYLDAQTVPPTNTVLTFVPAWVLLLQTSGTMRPVVRKKAALCLLRLMRKTPADSQMVTADSFAPIMAQLLEERDLGMLLCCVTLLLGICARCGSGELQPWQLRLALAEHAHCFDGMHAGLPVLLNVSSNLLWDAHSADCLTCAHLACTTMSCSCSWV
jgi:hypothetical protein